MSKIEFKRNEKGVLIAYEDGKELGPVWVTGDPNNYKNFDKEDDVEDDRRKD